MDQCLVHRLGRVPFEQARQIQEQIAAQIAAGSRPPTLLLLEHPHTYTFGRRGQAANLLWGEQELSRRGVEIHWTDRGGDITYHGPGQLVGYPLLRLPQLAPSQITHESTPTDRPPRADYLGYLRSLERVLIRTLAHFGVPGGQIPGLTGVWIQPDVASRCRDCPPALRRRPAKIAAIGVKVDASGITRHGFALNVCTDMKYWEGIVGCGLADHATINLGDLLPTTPSMPSVMEALSAAFGEVFGYQMVAEGCISLLE